MKNKAEIIQKIKNAGLAAREGRAEPVLATVSGVLSTKPNLIRFCADELGFGFVTTKSFQVLPNPGNREPVLCEPELGCFGNSVGLRNCGMEQAVKELKELRSSWKTDSILNVSLSASNPEDFISLLKGFEELADCFELNFSCPHASAGFGASIGCDPAIASGYVKTIKKALPDCTVPIFVKLTPNVEDIGAIAAAVIEAGADGITAINTVGPKVYIEPHSGKPILQNKLGGKGGMSGSWVFPRALECIGQIRKAVGEEIPIIGMGGVMTGSQAAELVRTGADIIGIGSACGMLEQDDLKPFFQNLASDALNCIRGKETDKTSSFLRKKRALEYEAKTIVKIEKESEDIIIITLNGKCKFEAGQFVFLWIPGAGEKPFSLAEADPISLIIKKRGPFTEALFELKEGDTIYMRGLYGKGIKPPKTENALLIAGGTGIAVLPALAKRLKKQGTLISTYVGTSEEIKKKEPNGIEKILIECGAYKKVADNGVIGRVLNQFQKDNIEGNTGLPIQGKAENMGKPDFFAAYLVGPMIFMRRASEILLKMGVRKNQIFMSLEMNTMCGVGICGECSCGNILTCKKGTFVSLDKIDDFYQ